MKDDDFSQFSLFDLFQQEADSQAAILTRGLLALERDPTGAAQLEELMRAAHSLKGAARIVGLDAAVRLAHVMEDCFVAAQKGKVVLRSEATDRLLKGTDLFARIARTPEGSMGVWESDQGELLEATVRSIQEIPALGKETAPEAAQEQPPAPEAAQPVAEPGDETLDRVLRVTAANLNRLLGLAGESLVESRRLPPFTESVLRLKRQQAKLSNLLEGLRHSLARLTLDEETAARLAEARQVAAACLRNLSDRHAELELFSHRSADLSHRLYREALSSRMRPFADAVPGFPRLIRDLARTLSKEAKLEIAGASTEVDREVLEKLESPLTHLLRNAMDHGLETPKERLEADKPREGTIRLEARHVAGLLMVIVEDDGRGLDPEALRLAVVKKGLTTSEVAEKMSEEELLDFLFLPGFSMRENVTEFSGRGVGLDVVAEMIKSVGGTVRVTTRPGLGMRFQMQLPLTLSVLRALLVEVGGEPYAFPLARIHSTLRVPREQIETAEGREHIPLGGQRIGLVSASQLLEKPAAPAEDALPVIILGERNLRFGLAVDKFLGERQLVVQPLDPRLGKIKDISAGALMPDGSPILIIDVEDLSRSIQTLVEGGHLGRLQRSAAPQTALAPKRVLVVDDSLTVRELERKLLTHAGYEVEVAVDGMDGWNAVRTLPFDLVITDVDMPRLDGIELVRLIKSDPRAQSLPVMIVSYKDRPEDRHRGLEAGADYYLTKGSFHDETLLGAVADLIGKTGGIAGE